MSSKEFPNTIFFFGAGASKPAGVGTTVELVKEFELFLERLNDNYHKEILNEIIDHLGHEQTDIEQLMTALEKLTTRDKDVLLKFYNSDTFKIKNHDGISKLLELLRMFIQQATAVKENKINFLAPLRSFPNPIKIFSVNYDTAIEQFCNVYKLRYTDGFDYEWNPKLFEDSTFDFHLKKIHGSIMWYRTDNANYVKLPLHPEDKIELIFGERATPLILYPMQKWEFVEPLLELLLQFKTQLTESEFVIIIGYSFRDSHIVRLLHESARKNRNLVIILIDPKSRHLYDEHLRYYASDDSQEKIPSLLENRVLCLEYGFEQIIGSLKEIVVDCKACLTKEQNHQKYLLEGHGGSSYDLISDFSKIEFLDRADEWKDGIKWAEKINWNDINSRLFTAAFRLFVIAEIQGKTESANYWLKHFLDAFILVTKSAPSKISLASNVINFSSFDIILHHNGATDDLVDLQIFIDKQKNLRNDKLTPFLLDVIDQVTKWFYYLYGNKNSISYDEYIDNVKNFFNVFYEDKMVPSELFKLNNMLDEQRQIQEYDVKKDTVLEIITHIELKILNTIFNGFDNLSKSIESKHPIRYNDIVQIR